MESNINLSELADFETSVDNLLNAEAPEFNIKN